MTNGPFGQRRIIHPLSGHVDIVIDPDGTMRDPGGIARRAAWR